MHFRVVVTSLCCVAATAMAGCGADGRPADGRIHAVAAFAPLAEAVRRVGGERVEVRDLTPPGVEPHDLEIAPDDMDRILDADLAVILGGGFQPAVEAAVGRRDGPVLVVLDAPGVVGDGGTGGPNGHGGDPHVWLDPTRMAGIVDAVAGALTDIDAAGTTVYRENAVRYRRELRLLDGEIKGGLADCESRTVITTHDAFGWLAGRYGLEVIGIVGISPDAAPDPKRLAEVADLARTEGVTTVFTETLVSRETAETVAREAGGLRTAVLNPFEGITDDERAAGVGYISVMRENLAALRGGLGCR